MTNFLESNGKRYLERASCLPSHLRSLPFSVFSDNPKANTELAFLPLRSLCWRIYLGILPDDAFGHTQDIVRIWPTHIQKERAAYQHLQAQWAVNPHAEEASSSLDTQDWAVLNPLSQDENVSSSVWLYI